MIKNMVIHSISHVCQRANDISKTVKLFLIFQFLLTGGFAQTPTTISSGSFIINMGITPQTATNGLKPYGLIYDLLANYHVPVNWVINTSKAKDGIDFSYNGTDFKGGPFIIEAGYRTDAVNARITFWQGLGVQGVTTSSPLTVPIYATLAAAPRWTLDHQNGSIAVNFFNNAGIPSTAYGGSSNSSWPYPSALTCCDDIFVMPHADPTWATHQRLLSWNLECRGAIWLGCHAGSALEDMFNNVTPDYSMQTNFLSQKTGPSSGAGPYYQNALVLWGNHANGTPPYTYYLSGEPVMQFMGTLDAATQNGSEQIYLPFTANGGALGGWRSTTKVGVAQPGHSQRSVPIGDPKTLPAIVAWGPGLGDSNRGNVMLEAAHNIAGSSGTANIAAQRAFFNFSFLTTAERAVLPEITPFADPVIAGTPVSLTFTVPPGTNLSGYTILWTSSLGGNFSPNATSQTVQWTPPSVAMPTVCLISVEISDNCGRKTFDTHSTTIQSCTLSIMPAVTKPTCFGLTNGSVVMTITGGTAPYNWTWNRTNPTGGPVSGTGTTISGLGAGSFNVSVSDASGCSSSFSTLVTAPVVLAAVATPTNIGCFGGVGTISLSVTGGTSPYTYAWTETGVPGFSASTQNLSNLTAGTYNVTVTDAHNCTATTSGTISQPSGSLGVSGSQTNVSCKGGANGTITPSVTGGTLPFTYDWADISGANNSKDRTGLAPGTFSLTVTDANGCSASHTFTITEPLPLSLSSVITNANCPGATDGAIVLTVSGGTAAYTFDWADLTGTSNPKDRSGLAAGIYNVTVSDANGCTATTSATVKNTKSSPVTPGTISK